MKAKILTIFVIPIICYIFPSFIVKPSHSLELNYDSSIKSQPLDTNYLKQTPLNFYILGPGDAINIIVSRDIPELNTLANISGEGTIFVPKLNKLYVEGLTLKELTNLLNEAYKEYVKYPDVEMEINKYRPIKVSIEGQITNPGLYTLTGSAYINSNILSSLDSTESNLRINNSKNTNITQPSSDIRFEAFPTVFDVIRKSGGITVNSDLSQIKVIRKNPISNGGGKVSASVNLEYAVNEGDYSNNIRIYDGDTIIIPKTDSPNTNFFEKASKTNINPKFINVVVTGRVNFPGLVRASKVNTLNDAIDIAGGAKVIRGKIKYVSFDNNGRVISRNIKYNRNKKRGSFSNPFLKDGDLVIVGNSLLGLTTEVINEVTNPLRGIVTTYALIEALEN